VQNRPGPTSQRSDSPRPASRGSVWPFWVRGRPPRGRTKLGRPPRGRTKPTTPRTNPPRGRTKLGRPPRGRTKRGRPPRGRTKATTGRTKAKNSAFEVGLVGTGLQTNTRTRPSMGPASQTLFFAAPGCTWVLIH
jgi:hypothetical protein